MTTPFTPVPYPRSAYGPDPAGDMDNTALQLLAAGSSYSVMNATYSGGADPTGTDDSTAAWNGALDATPAGAITPAPAGRYKTSAPVIIPPYITVQGTAGNILSLVDNGTCLIPDSAWAQGSDPAAAVMLMLNPTDGGYSGSSEEQKIASLMIDASNMTVQADGIQAYGAVNNVLIHDVAVNFQIAGGSYTSSVGGNGVSQVAAHGASPDTWRAQRVTVHRAGLSGFVVTSPDSTWLDCEAIGCNQQNTGAPGWAIATCSNSKFEGIRSENTGGLGNGITYTGANYLGGGVTFTDISTQGNGGHGLEITSSGNAGSGPVDVVGGRFVNDGWNPYYYLNQPAGTGGGGYAGIFITNAASPISLTGVHVFPGAAGSGYSPQYGLKLTSNNSLRPGVVNVAGSLLWGVSAAVYSDGTTPCNFDSACVFGVGAPGSQTFYTPGVPTTLSAAGNLVPALRPDLADMPAGTSGVTIPRALATANGAITGVSGTVYARLIFLVAGCPVNNLNFWQGSTVETAGTHGWFCLTDLNRKVVAVTADQTGATFFGTANAEVSLATTATYTPAYTGYYWIMACTVVSSGNVPNWTCGPALAGNISSGITGAPNICGTSSTGQTTPPALAATMAAISGAAADNLFAWTS